jgi:hypothetical protein
MQLARPLSPDQRAAFLEMVAAKLNGRSSLGDGQLYRLCRELQKTVFVPPIEPERHEPRHDRTMTG